MSAMVVYVMYRTPEYVRRGNWWVVGRYRYFPLVKPCVAFAKEQMKMRGGKGYSYESIPRDVVADLLTEFAGDRELPVTPEAE